MIAKSSAGGMDTSLEKGWNTSAKCSENVLAISVLDFYPELFPVGLLGVQGCILIIEFGLIENSHKNRRMIRRQFKRGFDFGMVCRNTFCDTEIH